MHNLSAYLPHDRLGALGRAAALPDRASGSALFADISGFTALTETLTRELGARRGAEELTQRINAVYDALITQVERHGGSVISFAGDAMTCWFPEPQAPGEPAALQAAACAFALQAAMSAFPALGLKVAVTTGAARRFVVGDPSIQLLDTLAGATIARLSAAEHLAQRGEVVVDAATAEACGAALRVQAWRADPESAGRFAVCEALTQRVQATAAPAVDGGLPAEGLRPWILPEVYAREQSGYGAFLIEFRPCVALFVRFTGIDYETDTAGAELDAFIQDLQTVASQHGGAVLQITIGDKGSYAYVSFGALSAHEDDPRRALRSALALRAHTGLALQIGVTQGVMRVGAYGGETRKTFGALGDDTNLAARLMVNAQANEILLSSQVYKTIREDFTCEPRPALRVKGKSEPVAVFALTGENQRRAVRLQEPSYALPMVGRTQELRLINERLDLAAQGQGQVIGILAEAGLGKSRLAAEVIREARRKGFAGFGGACQSDGLHTPYLAWKSIWQAILDVDHAMPLQATLRHLEGEIAKRAPRRADALPLLNAVLDLNIPENDFTKNLEPKMRQSALHALLEDCLKAQALDGPVLIVIEDLHWVDALSHELLAELARALGGQAVCFVLAYRPPQLERLKAQRIEALEQFTRIELHELTTAEAESAIRAKLAQLYPARGGTLPEGLVEALMRRAQGNPFYLEELLNYLRDRGLDPSDIGQIELPDSLHTLILSRIDQLSEQRKTTLRVASIVGRLFRAAWLTGFYPELGSFPQVKAALDALEYLEITPLDSPEPELAYLFKHIVTHEVTYESLPFATRARLHEQLARYLEGADAPVETIAFHYGRSENKAKQIEYLRKAGEAAQKNYANDAALAYYDTLLPLLEDTKERSEIHLKRAEVLLLVGRYDETESSARAALESAQHDLGLKAEAQLTLGKVNRMRGEYAAALEWLAQAKETQTTWNDPLGLALALIETGTVYSRKGDFPQAIDILNEGLALARQAGDKQKMVMALTSLGQIRFHQGDYAASRVLLEESLPLAREIGYTQGLAAALNNLGNGAFAQGELERARGLYEESLDFKREIGDKQGIATALHNLGNVANFQADYDAARTYHTGSLALRREIGDQWGIAASLTNLGGLAYSLSDYAAAQVFLEEALTLARKMGDKPFMAASLLVLGVVNLVEDKPGAREQIMESLRLNRALGNPYYETSCLVVVAHLVLKEGRPQFAAQLLGAVNSSLSALKAEIEVEVKELHTQTLAQAQQALGEAAFQSAWEHGAGWDLAQAVQMALEETAA